VSAAADQSLLDTKFIFKTLSRDSIENNITLRGKTEFANHFYHFDY